MSLVYITGVPGTGKSTVREELLKRGYVALGGAEDGLASFYNNITDERINRWIPSDERTPAWYAGHSWKIDPQTVTELKMTYQGKLAFVCATTTNDTTELWDLFDSKIALIADERTLRHRLMHRTNNDVGKSAHELEDILERQKVVTEMYTKLGAVLIDSSRPLRTVVDEIIHTANLAVDRKSYP